MFENIESVVLLTTLKIDLERPLCSDVVVLIVFVSTCKGEQQIYEPL